MDIDHLLVILLSALSSASILLIATLGLAVIFGLMGVINLAHGEFIMVGAYCALAFSRAGVSFPLAVVLSSLATALFGGVVERLIIRRLYSRLSDTLLATWGLSVVLNETAVLAFGSVTPGIGMPLSSIEIGEYRISRYLLLLIVVAVMLTTAVYWLLTRTGYGVMARAAIQDREMSAAVGIETARINTMTFAFGSGLAGFAGAILLPAVPATPNMGFGFVIKAFLVVVAAGPLVLSGTAAAAALLGMAASITASYWSTVAGDSLFFGATIALVRLFPKGISEHWRLKL